MHDVLKTPMFKLFFSVNHLMWTGYLPASGGLAALEASLDAARGTTNGAAADACCSASADVVRGVSASLQTPSAASAATLRQRHRRHSNTVLTSVV